MSRYSLRTLLILLAIGPPVLGLWAAWERLKWSNCGGNNAALSDVRLYTLIAEREALASPNCQFDVTSATPSQCRALADVVNDIWIRDAGFLVSTRPYVVNQLQPKSVVIVCDRPFRNVPRYLFGQPPPAYAAAFSDGTTALLTEKQFAALDHAAFVSLNTLIGQPH